MSQSNIKRDYKLTNKIRRLGYAAPNWSHGGIDQNYVTYWDSSLPIPCFDGSKLVDKCIPAFVGEYNVILPINADLDEFQSLMNVTIIDSRKDRQQALTINGWLKSERVWFITFKLN